MSRITNDIAGRLSLRAPQRYSLEILERITEIVPFKEKPSTQEALAVIRSEYPSVADFEREFLSVCFNLATGVGKTRLMGAFISYLHLAHQINNFFVLAPNLTIYNKLIADFTSNTPKYVFKGIAAFATDPPVIITGENYDSGVGVRKDVLPGMDRGVRINIFNISKINSEVRGGKSPRIKRLSEYIGESYFEYLANLPDLVLLMDESHRYRASAGARAINDLKPLLGLELTATPQVETSRGAIPFRNVIYSYPLAKAMEDGFVKEPAVVTRKDFNPAGMNPEEIERLKLEDGVRLHESVKVELETYARETGQKIVKPFLLVICRDTTHASQLTQWIQSEAFFGGQYQGKVIQVDSSRTGAEEDEMVERLLKVEHTDEPTEIVIHVNMLKEGWDVTNLYTIVPLRAANARTLIEQSIGRGLRLPYGRRTGVTAVDRLNIVAHDKFQEIVDEARRSDSVIRLKEIVLDTEELTTKQETLVSQPALMAQLGIAPTQTTSSTRLAPAPPPVFQTPEEQRIAQIAYEVMRSFESKPQLTPSVASLQSPEIQAEIVRDVQAQYRPAQLELEGTVLQPDFAAIVAKTAELVVNQTIDIPRILVVPKGEVQSGFKPFTLDLSHMHYQAPSQDLITHSLRTGQQEVLSMGRGGQEENRPEDYIVSGLIDYDDVSYDDHAELLYDLAEQTVEHLRSYLSEEDASNVLRVYQRDLAKLLHSQMQAHHWEEVVGYDVKVSRGFTALKECAYSVPTSETLRDFRIAPVDKSNMAKYYFGGFARCLYPIQKFHANPERILAVILDRDSQKWFRPVKGQFQIFYQEGIDHAEYQPDFVAETEEAIYLLECKRRDEMEDSAVLAKKEVAVKWCEHASDYARKHDLKPWQYLLIPHDAIAENKTIQGLAQLYGA